MPPRLQGHVPELGLTTSRSHVTGNVTSVCRGTPSTPCSPACGCAQKHACTRAQACCSPARGDALARIETEGLASCASVCKTQEAGGLHVGRCPVTVAGFEGWLRVQAGMGACSQDAVSPEEPSVQGSKATRPQLSRSSLFLSFPCLFPIGSEVRAGPQVPVVPLSLQSQPAARCITPDTFCPQRLRLEQTRGQGLPVDNADIAGGQRRNVTRGLCSHLAQPS